MLDLWYMALQSPYGIEVSCSETEPVRAKLYNLRREVQDKDLDTLSLCVSPFDPDKLWIVKRKPKP